MLQICIFQVSCPFFEKFHDTSAHQDVYIRSSADGCAVMALVTYTLLSALSSGLQSRFHPEVLGYSLSKAMAVVVGEFCAIKLGCYLLDVKGTGASGVELIGYGGYKFVG